LRVLRIAIGLLALFSAAKFASAVLGLDTHLHDISLPAGGGLVSPEEELRKDLRALFGKSPEKDSPGFAILVKKKQKTVFEEGFGLGDLRRRLPITARTNFRLASCTKQFTAMAIMLLVDDGRLRYDESLTDVFPEFPAYGAKITVRNLLNHTSGLPDYEELMDKAEKRRGPLWSPEKQILDAEVLALLESESQGKFAPGTKWEYSNSGYVVLGLIVAKRSGETFPGFLRDRIFLPLKMEHTLVFEKGKNEVANRAIGHAAIPADPGSRDFLRFNEADQSSTSATEGDGGIYSNLEDLSKWDEALRRYTLLGREKFAPAITPAALPAGADKILAEDAPLSMRKHPVSYGFGWFLNLDDPQPLVWHYGETTGFKTAIFRYAKDDVTVIFLANRTDLDQGEIALEAARLFLAAN